MLYLIVLSVFIVTSTHDVSFGEFQAVMVEKDLSIVSKIFERIVYDQVESYLSEQKLLYEFQSGFRSVFSTDTCLIHLSDYIRFNLDKGNYVGMVLLDLQKAFDTVDHVILLDKLKMIGVSPDVIRWFQSYLSGRKQCIDIYGTHSSLENVTCGVPQGSILGPLLFLIYVNDMAGVLDNKLLLYADDSAILVSGKSKYDIERLLTRDLGRVSNWLVDNKLSLHLGKTESILFGSKPKLKKDSNLNILCNGTVIQHTDSVKYLGATLDQCLSYETMVTSIIKKANARLKFLYRKQRFLSLYTKKMLVMSLIQCHFDYACSIWYYGISQDLKNRLQVTQNKIIRFILRFDQRSHISKDHFLQLGWLPVEKRVEQIILNHVFKIHSGSAPSYMNENFIPASSVHNHYTRFSKGSCFSIPKVRGFGKKSFSTMDVLCGTGYQMILRIQPTCRHLRLH